jgi:hypothetical protein
MGLIGIALRDGIWAAIQMLNPFGSIINFAVMLVTLAPGAALIAWGDNLRDKKRQTPSQ